jgi:glycosyltransferase involved in cell wall biosynthesis
MKIWILQDYLRSGGTERQTLLLARAFIASGHHVTVVLSRPGGRLYTSLGDIPSIVLQPFDTTLSWLAPGLIRVARAARPDVILCMGRMANCHAGRLARKLPWSVIVGTMRTGKPLPWLFRRSLHAVDHVVANSSESAAILQRSHGLAASKISVIHNALVFPPAGNSRPDLAIRSLQGAGPATCVLLCVGMLRPEKNHQALIRITSLLDPAADWQLWLAGEGTARAECETLAARLGVTHRVRFLGFQSDPGPLYHNADIAVLTSQAESLSNFLIEAQAHGLPSVAFDAGGISECLLHGLSGTIVATGDESSFASALMRLMKDPLRRTTEGRAAKEFARSAFDPHRQAGRYLELFATLIEAKSRLVPTVVPPHKRNFTTDRSSTDQRPN